VVPLLTHGFRNWLLWLSSVSYASQGGAARLRFEQPRSALLPQSLAIAADRHLGSLRQLHLKPPPCIGELYLRCTRSSTAVH
jgi:hypothetical protein